MRSLVLACALLLGGCYVHAHAPVEPPPPQPAPQVISQQQAVDIAFAVARERGLGVNQVRHARLDPAGRWHVELRGHGDRARLLLDGRDGRLLKGRFREHEPEAQD